jgi:hypothetical protein
MIVARLLSACRPTSTRSYRNVSRSPSAGAAASSAAHARVSCAAARHTPLAHARPPAFAHAVDWGRLAPCCARACLCWSGRGRHARRHVFQTIYTLRLDGELGVMQELACRSSHEFQPQGAPQVVPPMHHMPRDLLSGEHPAAMALGQCLSAPAGRHDASRRGAPWSRRTTAAGSGPRARPHPARAPAASWARRSCAPRRTASGRRPGRRRGLHHEAAGRAGIG